MQTSGKRRHKRVKMVLPIRVWAKDIANHSFNELAHTLDITPYGARLGAIHHHVKVGDKMTVQYRQRKMQFRIVWIKSLEGTQEFQVGIETSDGGDTWGLELSESSQSDSMPANVTS